MRTAREQEALTIRAQGAKQAQIIRAEADADASRIYAESFGKDPDFYDFYRAMQTYRQTFSSKAKGGASVILSPDNSYFKAFKGQYWNTDFRSDARTIGKECVGTERSRSSPSN